MEKCISMNAHQLGRSSINKPRHADQPEAEAPVHFGDDIRLVRAAPANLVTRDLPLLEFELRNALFLSGLLLMTSSCAQ